MVRAIENVHSAPNEQSWGSRPYLTGIHGVGERSLHCSVPAAVSCHQMCAFLHTVLLRSVGVPNGMVLASSAHCAIDERSLHSIRNDSLADQSESVSCRGGLFLAIPCLAPLSSLLMARVALWVNGLNRPLGGVATSSMARRREQSSFVSSSERVCAR